MITLTLPWPPSTNHYYRHVGWRTLISVEGRQYRKRVESLLLLSRARRMTGSLAVEIDAHPPDRRPRDLDNLFKCVLDSLQHGGLYANDAQIEDLHIKRRGVVPHGNLVVRITEVIGA